MQAGSPALNLNNGDLVAMTDKIIQTVLDFLSRVFVYPEIVTTLIAILPIVEARLAIPIGLGLGMGYIKSWLFAFVGSSLIVPLLLLVLIPFVKWLAKTKLFHKLGEVVYEKFESKSKSVGEADEDGEVPPEIRRKRDLKKMLGIFVFVAIPLPLTGVWTGSAVASIVKLPYGKAVASVIAGNLVASLIILLLCRFFNAYINYIILALALIAIVVVLVLIVKVIVHKPKTAEAADPQEDDADKKD